MKTLLFLLGAAVMVQAWPLDVDNVAADKPKFEGTKDGTKPLSGFFAGEDGVAGPINDVVDKPGPEESEPKQDESKSADSEHIVEVIPEMPSREERESTSNIFKCDVTKPITAELTINFHQVQDPAPKPEPTCMANWDYVSTLRVTSPLSVSFLYLLSFNISPSSSINSTLMTISQIIECPLLQ